MKTIDLSKLVRDNVMRMKAYSSARDEFQGSASVFLDANENPIAAPYNRYPDPHQHDLKLKIGELKSVPGNCVFLGNGSDEAIDLLFRAFCNPGKDNVIIPQPTYGMYSVAAALNDVKAIDVALMPEFDLDINRIMNSVTANTKMIFLCSPNNPSGNLLSIEKIKALLTSFEGIIVVDEAYIDFASQPSIISWLKEYENLVVLQTLSKAWGLAALRIGMCFANENIIRVLDKIKPPYNINVSSQQIALKALDRSDEKEKWVKEITNERNVLERKLSELSLVKKVYISDANFLLVKVNDAKKMYRALLEQGIVVRDRSDVFLCEECLRITIGTEEENKKLIKALNKLNTDK